jgi:hypothetical protein
MYEITIILKDGEMKIPIEKALLIPSIAKIIKNENNRQYYFNEIINSNYDKAQLVSILNMLK